MAAREVPHNQFSRDRPGALLLRQQALRSLYFVLAGAIRDLRFLRTGLGILLLFVAAKMLLADVIEIPPLVSLAVVAGIFGVAIVASRLFPDATSDAAVEATVACTHRDQIRDLKPETDKCAECVRSGDPWVELRMCLSCGNVACCDSSKNRHATKHFDATAHPIMRSIEPGENYVDRRDGGLGNWVRCPGVQCRRGLHRYRSSLLKTTATS